MRRSSLVLWSTSALAGALLATPALAQTTAPATPVDPTVEAQEGPNDPEAGSAETDDAVQTAAGADEGAAGDDAIVVTGLRRSLRSAQNIKRNSEQIVDAIVAEDIGKLPDVTASAALARVTGVQVTRAAAEAADVQVRGLPNISTTYNGREIFTAEGRSVAIQDFPAGAVGALEVFKSGTANLIEGGLGGQVNVRSRRPFDFSKREISGSFNYVYFEQVKDWAWNGNLLLSDRWDIGDGGEFGALINFAKTNIEFLDSTREQAQFIEYFVPLEGVAGSFRRACDFNAECPTSSERGRADVVRAPDAAAIYYGRGDRNRPSVNAALQYKPNADLQFYADGLFQGYRQKDSDFFFRAPAYGGGILSNVVLQEGTNQLERARVTGAAEIFGFNQFITLKTNTYQFGGGAIWDVEPFRISGDLAYTKSTVIRRQANLDIGSFGPTDSDIIFDNPDGDGGPSFELINFDTTDPTEYRFGGLFINNAKLQGDDIQGRVDLEWNTGLAALPRLQVGVRHNNRNSREQRFSDFFFRGNLGLNLTQLPFDPIRRESGFAFENDQRDVSFVGFDIDDVFDNLDELRTQIGLPTGDPAYDPLRGFDANEKATAGYGQIKYEFDPGIPIDGVVGLRVVHTKTRIQGTRRDDATGETFDLDESNSYYDYLPNISARLQLQPNLQVRGAYTETRTRPNFTDLSPSAVLSSPPAICQSDPTSSACFRNATSGNPDLRPIESRNLDATLEYYFSSTGNASIALFHRKVDGFIFRDVTEVVDPEFGRIRFDRPENAGKGTIKGLEAQITTFFDYDFLPEFARGFGAQANYTYIDASTQLSPQFRTQLPGQQGFPGISKHAYNLVGLYERGPVSARLAYNYRSKFIVEYNTESGFLAPRIEEGHGVLDFSASYTPFTNITFAFDALNILAGDPIKTRRAYNTEGDSFPFQRRYLERVYSFGVRFRLGGGEDRPAPAAFVPAPPPPVMPPAPEPVMEQPAPPPPPPPAPAGERG